MAVSSRAGPACGSIPLTSARGSGADGIAVRVEEQEPGGGQFAPAANLESHRRWLAPYGEDDFHVVAGTKRAAEPEVASPDQDALTRFLLRDGDQDHGEVSDRRQDRLAVEMALEATTLGREAEPRDAG